MGGVIKLSPRMKTISLKDDGSAVQSAFDEIQDKLYHIDGPFFMMDFGNEGVATLELKPFDNKIRLSFITVPEKYRGRGLASRALKTLTDIADKHGVPITLTVQPTRNDGGSLSGFTKKKLFDWYKRHGFVSPYSLQPSEMERAPGGKAASMNIASELLKVAKELLDIR